MTRGGATLPALLAALVTLALPRASLAELAHPVVERRLANGLRVVVCPDPSGADVTVLMRYDVGSRDEPGGLFGLAHLVEHLMFTGSKHVGPNEHFRLLQRAGATNINGETSFDETQYHETIPPDALALALWLESDRLGYLLDHLDAAAVARERATVQNEQRHSVLDVPFGDVGTITQAELFPVWHPYHHAPLGTPVSVGNLDLADVRAFVSTWYGPSNATLVITGKVDPAAAMALAERYFATLPARPSPARLALPPLPQARPVVLHVGARVSLEQVRVSWVTPRLGAPGDAELDLAATILLRRLQRSAVGGARVAIDIEGGQRSMALASMFEIHATVAEGHTSDEVFAVIDAAIIDLARALSPEELGPVKTSWYNGKLFRLDTSLSWAQRLALTLRLGPAPPTFDGQLGAYAAITPAAVLVAVQRYLRWTPQVVTLAERDLTQPPFGALLLRSEGTP
jgi:zinc protease